MNDLYRLTFETVAPRRLGKYSNADPMFYSNTTQVVPNSQVPDEDWHEVTRETGDPWSQYNQLRKWADGDEQFIRNVRLERMIGEPHWEPVPDRTVTDPDWLALFTAPHIRGEYVDGQLVHRDQEGRTYRAVDVDGEVTYVLEEDEHE